MLSRLTNTTLALLKNIQFCFHRKPRDPSVPTQLDYLAPFTINNLHDNPGARYWPKRVGRGPGSGKGKMSGRGMKGTHARAGGKVHPRFEGGQTPIQKRLPKYGRVVQTRPKEFLDYINLDKIDYYVKLGVLDATKPITIRSFIQTGIIKKVKFGVKVLGRGAQRVNYPLRLQVTDASLDAINAIKKAGGSVSLIFRTPLKLKQHMYPHKYPLPLRDPITPAWKIRKLQRISAHRGIEVSFPKPKWLIEDEAAGKTVAKEQNQSKFVFPVPIVPNSGKIRHRKEKVYRKISYNLP